MGLLSTEGLESVVRDDVRSSKVLEFRAVSAGFLRERHKALGAIEVTVVIRGDIRDEVRRLIGPHASSA